MKGARFARRELLAGSAVALAAGSLRARPAALRDELRIGLVGCGGRGCGAASEALNADERVRLVAVADAFEDPLAEGVARLEDKYGARAAVPAERRFVGFDAYQGVLDAELDAVLLATPPHFRPLHLRAALEAGKHVFAEKPAAVDAPGVRSVLESARLAREKGLSIVAGLHSRYSPPVREWMGRVHAGAVGRIVALNAVHYADGVWVRPRVAGMSEMEYQMRNWYYFTWLSGDFNVEQFVHQYDLLAWAMGGEYPLRCYGTGGRQARTGAEHGHVFDHVSSTFEFAGGARAFAATRHQPGCSQETRLEVLGTRGTAVLRSHRKLWIEGEEPWEPDETDRVGGHQREQSAFVEALRAGRRIDDAEHLARSTLLAIQARMCAYTGRTLTWEEALASEESLAPSAYAWDAAPPPAVVAVPGVTPFR